MKFNKIITVDIDARECGRNLALRNSEEQAKFFEGLREGMEQFSGGDKDGMQMLYIKDGLTPATVKFITKLAEYLAPSGESHE